jgi:transposase-like protein
MYTDKTHGPDFEPPFCPNPNCMHHSSLSRGWRYKRRGHFIRQTYPYRIRRFTCLTCDRSFSTQTFSTTYWQKRPDIMVRLFTKTTGCMSNRQIARDLEVAPETVNRQLARLGRHCMLFHTSQMQMAPPVSQVVVDGFVTFELSQYYPFHHHTAVEKGTDFFLYFTDSPVRRSGTMTAVQKRRRAKLEAMHGRPDPKAVQRDMAELLRIVIGRQPGLTIYSDDHKAYPRAIRSVCPDARHEITPGSEHRDANNPLWEVNLLDLLIRHSGANHKRETIAWSKRRQASSERLAVFLVWRNYMKGRREKVRGSPTPAMDRGMCDRRLTAHEVLGERIFRTRVELPARWSLYYGREIMTRALGTQRVHQLKHAA